MRLTNRHGKPARRNDGSLKTPPLPVPHYRQPMERNIVVMHRRLFEQLIRQIARRVRRAVPCS